MGRKSFVNFLLIVLFYILLTFFFASGNVIYYNIKGVSSVISEVATYHILEWFPWAFFTLVVIFFAKRFTFSRDTWFSSLMIHFLAVLLLTAVHAGIIISYYHFILSKCCLSGRYFLLHFIDRLHYNVLIYSITFGAWHFVRYYKNSRERELKTSRLEAQLNQAKLDALKMQLHPHFLFNTLHVISTLLVSDTRAADRIISRLSDLLRMSLENENRHEVPLIKEVDFLKKYLEIEKIRFQDRLDVTFDIQPDTLDLVVPNMILQPLVENAVKHGVSPCRKGARIHVQARQKNTNLCLCIENSCTELKTNQLEAMKKGDSFVNIQKRLVQLYGDRFSFLIETSEKGGVVVTIEIPVKNPDHLFQETLESSNG